MKYSMFHYRRSLSRASDGDLRRAAEAVVDAALICQASRGNILCGDPADASYEGEFGDGKALSEARNSELRERLIEAILKDPSRTTELFRS